MTVDDILLLVSALGLIMSLGYVSAELRSHRSRSVSALKKRGAMRVAKSAKSEFSWCDGN
jgi:hypothetical protein